MSWYHVSVLMLKPGQLGSNAQQDPDGLDGATPVGMVYDEDGGAGAFECMVTVPGPYPCVVVSPCGDWPHQSSKAAARAMHCSHDLMPSSNHVREVAVMVGARAHAGSKAQHEPEGLDGAEANTDGSVTGGVNALAGWMPPHIRHKSDKPTTDFAPARLESHRLRAVAPWSDCPLMLNFIVTMPKMRARRSHQQAVTGRLALGVMW